MLDALGPELRAELSCTDDLKRKAMAFCYPLCGECHEEILSEPVYLPSVMRVLREHFVGSSRVDKILLLARMLRLGAEALAHEGAGRMSGDGLNRRPATRRKKHKHIIS
ncbi:MAG: hypothetical protein ACHQ50_15020 [Fimbriimonadales bacterium]